MNNNTVFVNVYEVEQRYGGAEEGGWYYSCGTPIISKETTCIDLEHDHVELCPAGRWESVLKDRYNNEASYARSFTHDDNGTSYLDTMDVPAEAPGELVTSGNYQIMIETHPGEAWPNFQPHYE